jgi:hypothetical protein
MSKIVDASGQHVCYPHVVCAIVSARTILQAVDYAKKYKKKIFPFGTLHSQAGQVCWNDAIALNMNTFNRILQIDLNKQQITVESGILWKDIQNAIHPHGLALQVMQFVNTFTVAGSMSANIFSRDPRRSRLIEVIVSFTLITSSGEIIFCSRYENSELFILVIEGHGLFGVIAEVTIQLIFDTLLIYQTATYSPLEYLQHVSKVTPLSKTPVYHHAQYVLNKQSMMDKIIATDFYAEELSKSKGCVENALTRHQLMSLTREMELTFWDPSGSDALLGFFIPIETFLQFEETLKLIIKNSPLRIFKCSTNYLPGNHESFLSKPLGPCIKVAVFYRQDNHIQAKKATNALKKACAQVAAQAKGTLYLTFDFNVSPKQMDVFYPNWRVFLMKKRYYDPQELFYSAFYKKLCRLDDTP